MNKKVAYAVLPALVLVALMGVSKASAHGFGGGWFGGGPTLSADEIASRQTTAFQKQADLLGISVDDVKAAWAEGKSIGQLAQEKGITETQLQEKMKTLRLSEMKSNLQTLVQKGVITQAQADQRLNFMQTTMDKHMGKGMRGGHHGMMGGDMGM